MWRRARRTTRGKRLLPPSAPHRRSTPHACSRERCIVGVIGARPSAQAPPKSLPVRKLTRRLVVAPNVSTERRRRRTEARARTACPCQRASPGRGRSRHRCGTLRWRVSLSRRGDSARADPARAIKSWLSALTTDRSDLARTPSQIGASGGSSRCLQAMGS